MFERFWAAYPKHKSKATAKKAWAKLNPSMELCRTMAAALDAQKKSFDWTKENGRYIPYASTWLNQRRWEDEVEVSESDRAPEIPSDDERRGRFL